MTERIILPGIGGSGPGHWQSRWQQRDPAMRRFKPSNWDAPDLADWERALDREVAISTEPPWLVAHSLGCLLIAHWANTRHAPIAGAFMVAVPDPASREFP